MADSYSQNIDSMMLGKSKLTGPAQEDLAGQRLRQDRTKKSEEEKSENMESDQSDESFRSRYLREKLKKSTLAKTAVSTKDKAEKVGSAVALNWLWGITASVVGFIPGFLALNILAFLSASGIAKKIQFRLIDKIGLLFLDFIVFTLFIGVLGFLTMIINFIGDSWWDSLKSVWDAFMVFGWEAISALVELF